MTICTDELVSISLHGFCLSPLTASEICLTLAVFILLSFSVQGFFTVEKVFSLMESILSQGDVRWSCTLHTNGMGRTS